jgi:hypothetical protein
MKYTPVEYRAEIMKGLESESHDTLRLIHFITSDHLAKDLDGYQLLERVKKLKPCEDDATFWVPWQLAERATQNGDAASDANVEVEQAATQAEIPYPVEVWSGTIYGDFADAAHQGNYIPLEFFIEALKTVVGSIVGDRVTSDQQGGNMRQYTVLVGGVGKGKGTAARAAVNLLSELEAVDGARTDYLRVCGSATDYKHVGSVKANVASEVGLYPIAKDCSRVLLIPPEFSELLAKIRIEGSALPATICELFDTIYIAPSVSAKRAPKDLPSRCLLSMLSTTQAKKLQDALAMHGGLGEGLVSRITFIQNLETKTVAMMPKLKQGEWFQKLLKKLKRLDSRPEIFKIADDAHQMLSDWWQEIMDSVEENEEIVTRVNVLTLRNALHLAWLRSDPDERQDMFHARSISKEDMEKAIKLGDYQLALRRTVIVNETLNDLASQQQKIVNYIKRHGPTTGRALMLGTNYRRVGTVIYHTALKGLVESGDLSKQVTYRKNQFQYAIVKNGI